MSAKTAKIEILRRRAHAKASEEYVDVKFRYPDEGGFVWTGSVPVVYRRTGVNARTGDEVSAVVEAAYEAMRPSLAAAWLKEQKTFWRTKPRAGITQAFFDVLSDSEWKCQVCDLPANPNWARRTQDIKDFGYTLATNTSVPCKRCGQRTTHLQLLHLPRGAAQGYETWSIALRTRIIRVLGSLDAYEDSTANRHLLPDHKFPEIRWDGATRAENPDDMGDAEIRAKFQLLSNQRNQQKREVCRTCYQTGRRGTPFGVAYFYSGDGQWPSDLPRTGKQAEEGCVGCGWYDLEEWRTSLNELLQSLSMAED